MTNQTDKEVRFKELLQHYDGVVRRICFMYAGNNVQFDDLYQETMLNIWRGLDNFRGDASLSTWVYRATVNSCLSWLRYNWRHNNVASLDEALNVVAGDDVERREQIMLVHDMIAHLNPLQKSIVIMWIEGHSYDEIAAVTGLSRDNVAVRLHRIKKNLKQNLTP